jgi:hypothetical protein
METKPKVISSAWTRIDDWQFMRDSTITSIQIHDKITGIGKCAFARCGNLEKADIGKNVIFIGKYAFRKDNRPGEMCSITEVINRAVKPQIINRYHFHNNDLSKAALRVPAESIEAYRQAEGWKDFGKIEVLDEEAYPPVQIKDEPKNKKKKVPVYADPFAAHVWIGAFNSAEELEEYADNSEYEWEYYGHILGEDNFDEPPEEYGLLCGFCAVHGIQYEEAADIADNIFWQFYEKEAPLEEILTGLPVETAEVLKACREKYPALKTANSWIIVFGWHDKKKVFQKAKADMWYLGEFDILENDDDGRYDAWA